MRYSLANYVCTIKPNDPSLLSMFGIVNIGGEGSATDFLTASRNEPLFSTDSYSTGGYVHNKNLSKTGAIAISINQLATNVGKLKRLVNAYQSGDYDGLTITVTTSDGEIVCTGVDSVPTQIPTQEFRNTASNQTWTFNCGEINFE